MTSKLLIFITCTFLFIENSFCQQDPTALWTSAIDLLKQNKCNEAKSKLIQLINSEPNEPRGYHFLGVAYDCQNLTDSAIFYYKLAFDKNQDNFQNTKVMALVRLIRAYLHKLNFEDAFKYAHQGLKDFPDNPQLEREFIDVCEWSYYIKYQSLDTSYLLSTQIKDEYKVSSVTEEYLILRNIRINDKLLNFSGQSYLNGYDILHCSFARSTEKIDVKFKLLWEVELETNPSKDQIKTAETVFKDSNEKLYYRLGAYSVYKSDNKAIIKKALSF